MFNLGVLDTAIAVVIVLLLLSLIVQSIQTFLKKVTRFKSRQIAASLEKLFTQVPQTSAAGSPKEMKDSVLKYFADLGRASLFGNHAAAQPNNGLLEKAAGNASTLAQVIANVNTHVAIAKAQLNARLDTLESWFDTVMQGFQERYARNMRTWSFAIGLAVAIAMNANIVQVYQRFSSDAIERQRVIARGAVIQEQYTKQISATPANNQLVEQMKSELAKNAETYNALGFTPMTTETWGKIWAVRWTPDFWETLIGWLVMAFLLSLGAPFWHDALESLFGVKNLLQQKTDQKNVAQGSGEGKTQSS